MPAGAWHGRVRAISIRPQCGRPCCAKERETQTQTQTPAARAWRAPRCTSALERRKTRQMLRLLEGQTRAATANCLAQLTRDGCSGASARNCANQMARCTLRGRASKWKTSVLATAFASSAKHVETQMRSSRRRRCPRWTSDLLQAQTGPPEEASCGDAFEKCDLSRFIYLTTSCLRSNLQLDDSQNHQKKFG